MHYIAAHVSAESERVPSTLLFNKITGMFIVAVSIPFEEYENQADFYIAIGADFNHVNDTVVGGLIIKEDGTYVEDFKVMSRDEAPRMVYESQLNAQAEYKITKKYSIVDQINVLSRAIQAIAKKAGVDVSELTEMQDYIDLCLQTNATQKAFYRDNPDIVYVSDEQKEADDAARLEGGLHEALGPRTVGGIRISGTTG
ncbi:hypothetical protein AVT69_gp153 [Pseudomonas phage PhiPA3]|uniref:Uncharacterized protein 155 n=1 Tax=Pseudomonas phage PhiPA3 TaxID=998086 RepID=F8SK28_BPPA3|nr:hypothetical protein AVT69_gp153 [Pseudomonas phage PhiPA3]AEH03578.1 hypothetical protein [Pseudomonas phage PhiPA3]